MKDYTSKLIALTEESNRNKRKSVDLELINEQKQILNNQKHQALRSHLTKLEVEFNNLKQKLDKEVRSHQFNVVLVRQFYILKLFYYNS